MTDDRSPDHDDQTMDNSHEPTMDVDPDATIGAGPDEGIPGERPGATIGRYHLVRTLGEGGFGTVYLAEQLEPVSREVALKVIKLGMDTKQVIGRFEAERQALAMMDHPGIAKVLDAGATDTGRPYFVMELVRGVPITRYCDKNRLNTNQRLELFNQVCAAVQHAHQKGIIHRDLKPSNVLVTEVEGKAVPKVIDFGIAKATSHRLTEKTVFTQQAQIIGTPAYMSPEQAEVTELDIDTRSDVYSLGVLLYELLAGTTPFDGAKLLSAGYGEIQRIIREEEPPRPSRRASALGERLEETAEYRQLRGAQLIKRLDGELDWIVMRCLEKDRTRRYETANGLAADVMRFLANEPVTASPPSRSYRLRKLIIRNRAVFAAGLAMVLLLTAGVVGTSVGLVRAKQAEREAVTAAATSDRVAAFLTDMLSGVGPSAARGRDTEMLEEILQQTQEKLGTELAGEPEVEGTIRSFLGQTYFDLGRNPEALEQFIAARDLLIEANGEEDEDVAKQYGNLGLVYEGLQEFEASEEAARRSLEIRLGLFGENSAAVSESKLNLANLLVNVARYDEAEPLLREALAVQRETLGEEHENIAISLNSLGNLMQHLRRYDEAGPYYEEALAMHTRLLGADHPFVITDGVNLGWLSYNLGDYEEAARYFGDAEVVGRRVYGESHPKLVEILRARASCEHRRGNSAEGEALYREAWAMADDVHGPDGIHASEVMAALAALLKDVGRVDEGLELHNRVLEVQRKELGEHHVTTLRTRHNLAYAYYSLERYDEAVRRLRESRAAYIEGAGLENERTSLTINALGRALRERGDLEEAEAVFAEAIGIRERVLGEDHLMVHVSHYDLALTRRGQGRLDEAAAMIEGAVAGYYAHLDSTHWAIGQALSKLAEVRLDQGRFDEALDPARRGRDLVAGKHGEDSDEVVAFAAVLMAALGRSGEPAAADSLLASISPRLDDLEPRKQAMVGLLIGRHLSLMGRHEAAEEALLAAHGTATTLYGADHFRTGWAVAALVEFYESRAAAGSPTAAAAARRWQER